MIRLTVAVFGIVQRQHFERRVCDEQLAYVTLLQPDVAQPSVFYQPIRIRFLCRICGSIPRTKAGFLWEIT